MKFTIALDYEGPACPELEAVVEVTDEKSEATWAIPYPKRPRRFPWVIGRHRWKGFTQPRVVTGYTIYADGVPILNGSLPHRVRNLFPGDSVELKNIPHPPFKLSCL